MTCKIVELELPKVASNELVIKSLTSSLEHVRKVERANILVLGVNDGVTSVLRHFCMAADKAALALLIREIKTALEDAVSVHNSL